MRIVKRHNTTKQAARQKMESLQSTLMQQFGDKVSNSKYEWQGDVMEFSGKISVFNIEGKLHVKDEEVILDVSFPFLLRPYQGKIQGEIERQLDELFPG